MRPKQNFSLLVGEETYRPVKVEVLETEAWKDERWLEGYRDGKMRAVLEFTVPDNVDSYGLLLKNELLEKGLWCGLNRYMMNGIVGSGDFARNARLAIFCNQISCKRRRHFKHRSICFPC